MEIEADTADVVEDAEKLADLIAVVFRVLEGQSLCTEWSDEVMASVAMKIVTALRDGNWVDV